MPNSPAAVADQAFDPALQTFLVADVGGTNCRLGLAQRRRGTFALSALGAYKCADFPTAEDAIDSYLRGLGQPWRLAAAVIAVAGPVRDGLVQSTNAHWRMSEAELRLLGLPHIKLINDYTALALAVEHLPQADLIRIGPDLAPAPQDTVAVLGAGTGFGAGALARGLGGQAALATEGGHIAFAPGDDVDLEIMRILARRYGRVSIERLLSGPGLLNIRAALAQIEGVTPPATDAEDLVREARGGEALSQQALHRFCAIYGATAGDFALAYGARGGVFLGGGIAPAIAPELRAGAFRRRFEDKGRFRDYMAAIPTHIINHSYAALLGAAALAEVMAGPERPSSAMDSGKSPS